MQELYQLSVRFRKHGRYYGVNCICFHIPCYQRTQEVRREPQNVFIKCRFTHACEVQIKALSLFTLSHFNCSAYFIYQVHDTSVTMEPIFVYVTKLTFHGTAFLGGNSYYHFLTQIYFSVLHSLDFFVKTQEVSFNISFLSVVSNYEKLQFMHRVYHNFTSVCINYSQSFFTAHCLSSLSWMSCTNWISPIRVPGDILYKCPTEYFDLLSRLSITSLNLYVEVVCLTY